MLPRSAFAAIALSLAVPSLARAQAPTTGDATTTPPIVEEGSPAAAPAQEPDATERTAKTLPDSGLSLAIRLALGLPLGDSAGNSSQSSEVFMALPLQLDVGYRFLRHFYVGAYGSWAFDLARNTCPNTCYDARFGIGAEIHGRYRRTDPWFGVGGGYEILHGGGGATTSVYRGWELLNLQAGLHVRSEEQTFRAGPFLAVALGEYDHIHETNGASGVSGRPIIALHGWLMIGARGEFDL